MSASQVEMPAAPGSGTITAVRPTNILKPGLALWAADLERYPVPGGGAIVIFLEAGDRLTVTDREGRQGAEVVAFAQDGTSDPAALGTRDHGEASGLKQILGSGSESAQRVHAGLARRKLSLANARAAKLFGGESLAGASAEFTAEKDLVCIVGAPGEAMMVDAQDPPTDLTVMVRRVRPRVGNDVPLPEPLADPRLDLRIAAATASGYEVKAGEYIQIIDVAGRECSDFQAFTQRGLDGRLERSLDPTTTRTLMGAAYPGPGLFSKFFDQDMQPLVEVIRDTVGRHDSFGLACAAKYYEDMGYPGHANCSENFNGALGPYGVTARKGWEAINFFYNTNIDAQNVLYFDEPWSRPGDYVLLRAMTDLVCCSSACPCDIDAANGWTPTDIHVRVYSEKNLFSKAIAQRMTPDADAKLTRETAFHPRTSELTRDMSEYKGYWLPNKFHNHGAIDEYWTCREKAVALDLSALRKFEILGPDAEALLQHCLTRNVRRLAVGQVVYSAMCYEHGGMIDDGTLFRLGDNNFRWIGGDDYGGVWLREQAEKLGMRAWVKSSTDQLHNIAVQGPLSREILKSAFLTPPAQPSVAELGWFRFPVGRLGNMNGRPVVVSRTGYSGELGYELFCHPNDAPTLFDAVMEAGEPLGVAPFGLGALDMVRIEAGLVFAGYEFDDQTDPFEAGIGFTVPLKTKEDDFVGRDALLERKAHPRRTLVGLEMDGNETAAPGDCVHVGRAQIGEVTSATRSPILKKNIALCRMDVKHAALGTVVEVGKLDGHQLRLPAKVVRFPFYDPEKTRVRA